MSEGEEIYSSGKKYLWAICETRIVHSNTDPGIQTTNTRNVFIVIIHYSMQDTVCNMEKYPIMKVTRDILSLIFNLNCIFS